MGERLAGVRLLVHFHVLRFCSSSHQPVPVIFHKHYNCSIVHRPGKLDDVVDFTRRARAISNPPGDEHLCRCGAKARSRSICDGDSFFLATKKKKKKKKKVPWFNALL